MGSESLIANDGAGGGPVATQTRPDGSVTSYEYDPLGQLLRIARGPSALDLRERLEYTFDAYGRKTAEAAQANEGGWVEKRRTSFEYDSDDRMTATVHPGGARIEYAYDAAGNVRSVKDETHAAPNTTYAYDPAARLAEVRQTLGTGAAVTAYAYDPDGNLVSVTDPNGNLTTYVYDDFGRMLRQVSPVTGTTAYAYDPAGNMTATTDANGATSARTWDALGRVTSALSTRAGVPSEQVSWTYDTGAFGVGRLARMDDPTGFTTYTWTRAGQLAKEEKSVAGAVWTTTFHYDAAGNRTRVGYPSGRQVTYAYDFAGRPVSALDGSTMLVSAAAYLPFGPLESLTYGNGTTKTMTYDARYRPTTNALAGPLGTIAAYQYDYDDAGNITAIDDLVDASWSRGFGYDDLHRLVTANGGASLWGAGTYQYDAMGNMTSLALGTMRTASFAYAGTTPKLTSATENGLPRAVQYDAAGNEILVGTTASSYSPRNHLFESEGLRYTYDGRGIRTLTEVTDGQGASLLDDPAIRIADASVVRREPEDDRSLLGRVLDRFFPRTALSLGVEADLLGPMSLPPTGSRKVNVYLPELQLLTESEFTTGTPIPAWDYVWFAGEPLAQIEVATGATRWTFNDHLGTPLLQTDITGAVVWRLEQEPYGAEVTFRAGASLYQPLRFLGQERGSEDDTSYNVYRWYRDGWGRYTQVDPIDHRGMQSLYGYALNNAVRFIDPDGRAVRLCCRPLGSGIGTATGMNHCYIQRNATDTWGLHPMQTSVGKMGVPQHNNSSDTGGQCGDWTNTDACVLKYAKAYPVVDYKTFGPNSNTYARCIADKCSLPLPPNANDVESPGWNDDPIASYCKRDCGK